MSKMEFRLLDSCSLSTAGTSVKVHSTKTLALLAYLAMEEGVSHSRAKLATLLWGETSDDRALKSLRQALYSLNQVLRRLGDSGMSSDRRTVLFQIPPELWVDAAEFASLATSSGDDIDSLLRAAQLYRGTFLEGIDLPDATGFENWLALERSAMSQLAFRVHQGLVDALLQQGKPCEAMPFAQRLATIEPLNEVGHCSLMRLHALLGDGAAVHHQYRTCAALFDVKLGREPSPETQALYRQLTTTVANATPQVNEPLLPRLVERPLDLPILGREPELAALEAAWNKASVGRGGVVFVSGGLGLGKTSLVAEFVDRCVRESAGRNKPVRALIGRCYEIESEIPYTMWSDALKSLAAEHWSPHLAGLPDTWRNSLGDLVPAWAQAKDMPHQETHANARRLLRYQAVVQSLAHLTRSCFPLFFFDDLHWADAASLELLHYVARHLQGHPLLIVGAYRSDTIVDSLHLTALLRHLNHSQRLHLTPLDDATVGRLMDHGVPEVSPETRACLHQHSEGNPFVLVETLRALIDSSGQTGGPLSLEPDGMPLAPRVQDIIQSRLSVLDAVEQRVLAAAAVIGRPFGICLLAQVLEQSELQLSEQLERLTTRAFLSRPSHYEFDFQHEYLREVVYGALGPALRRALHQRVADVLLAMQPGQTSAVAEEVAYHYERAEVE